MPSQQKQDQETQQNHLQENQQQEQQKKAAEAWKLFVAVTGIYGAYLYYGVLQEDVFRYESSSGEKFHYAWFLHTFEALANILIALIVRIWNGSKRERGLPLHLFFLSGASCVFSKGLTSLSLASGLSYPVATLCKAGKMAPVMMGQLLLGGTTYEIREYAQVATIITGTLLLSLGKKKTSSVTDSTIYGVIFILFSLVMDGCTAGLQKRLKVNMEKIGKKPTQHDFMLYSNISMMIVALLIACVTHDFFDGFSFLRSEPELTTSVIRFCMCSAIGQYFIFYTIAHFDPLLCTTITTTRKIVSVLWSIFTKGHILLHQGWFGIALAIIGLTAEVQGKFASRQKESSNNNRVRLRM